MIVSGQPAPSVLDSLLNAQNTRPNINVTGLKKAQAQDAEKQEGMATAETLEQSVPPPQGPLLDVYA